MKRYVFTGKKRLAREAAFAELVAELVLGYLSDTFALRLAERFEERADERLEARVQERFADAVRLHGVEKLDLLERIEVMDEALEGHREVAIRLAQTLEHIANAPGVGVEIRTLATAALPSPE